MRLGLTSLSHLWQYPSLPSFSQTSLGAKQGKGVELDDRLVTNYRIYAHAKRQPVGVARLGL